ncbi:MAG: pantoate--beta-alanine ligase [Solirubrobacteraceae bacterium]
MRTLRRVAELRAALAGPRRAGARIGLVPTMGAFHEGHLSLMRRARRECDEVVVSLFVNPAQFNQASDLADYPRDEDRDAVLAAEVGVDYLFAPGIAEVYPPGFASRVTVAGITERLEGAHRGPEHFAGVATVVTKLLNMVGPDVAYFGQKDAQQVLVIKHLIRDLDIPVRIETCPTVREPDGLAMSSRNALLSAPDRRRAAALHRALQSAQAGLRAGERDPSALAACALSELRAAGVEPEYLELVSENTLKPVSRVEGDVVALLAARVGGTRLIDNQKLSAVPTEAVATTSNGRR